MRRVSGVEGVEAKLNLRLLLHREFTEEGGVLIKGARPAYRIKAGSPECRIGYWRKRQGIEPGLGCTRETSIADIRENLVRTLGVAWSIQRGARRRHAKRVTRIGDGDAVDLPAGNNGSSNASLVEPPLPSSEGQLRHS